MTHKKIIFVLVILFCGLSARSLFFYGLVRASGTAGFHASQNEDSGQYLILSENLLSGHFSRDLAPPYTPERFRTPGYPLFLILATGFGHSLTLAIILQNFLFLVFIYFLFMMLEPLAGLWPSAMASLVLALDPTIIYWNNQLTSETIFTILLSLSVFFLFRFLSEPRYRLIVWSMVWLVASMYVRPISTYLPLFYLLILAAHIIFKQLNLKNGLIAAVVVVLIWQGGIWPWQWRNEHWFGQPIFSTANSTGFGKYLTAMQEARGDTAPDILPLDYQTTMGEVRKQQLITYVKAYPLLFVKIHLVSLVPFLLGDGYANSLAAVFPNFKKNISITDWLGDPKQLLVFLKNSFSRGNWIFIVGKLVWGGITALAIVGLVYWISQDKKKWLGLLSLALVIYYFALASGIGSYSRFRFPVNPLILILFAFGFKFISNFYAHFTHHSDAQ